MSNNNMYKNYNPDILETIANLSNDEVFTPPKLANEILDLLPEEVWNNPNLTFLDPAVKTGIFLREIASRLIDGLADQIPDLQERVNHILTKQVFGIGITELTTLMARRTVYCSMTANGPFSIVTEFDNEKGNIIFPDTEHTWDKNGRCEYCGANEINYSGGENEENHAYPFIHDNFEKEFGNMKFDVIIGNPPYQLNTGGGAAQATPLYNKFVEKAIELNPMYITMIVPSRWMKGGMGLNEFREKMINEDKISVIVDYEKTSDVFESQGFDGGVNYFLWDSEHKGNIHYKYIDRNGQEVVSNKSLKNEFVNVVIRDDRQLKIIEKALKDVKVKFDSLVSSIAPYGFGSDLLNDPQKYSIELFDDENEGRSLVYGLLGTAGSGKRGYKYINTQDVIRDKESIGKYKLFFSKAFNLRMTVPPEIIKGEPGTLSTGTFLKIGDFNSEEEMLNCLSYIKTKFFRALFYYRRHSLNITRSSFELIPLQDFSKPWTDEELYKKYKLTQEEINYIEDNIDPMD